MTLQDTPNDQLQIIGCVLHTETRKLRKGKKTRLRKTRAGAGDFGLGLVEINKN